MPKISTNAVRVARATAMPHTCDSDRRAVELKLARASLRTAFAMQDHLKSELTEVHTQAHMNTTDLEAQVSDLTKNLQELRQVARWMEDQLGPTGVKKSVHKIWIRHGYLEKRYENTLAALKKQKIANLAIVKELNALRNREVDAARECTRKAHEQLAMIFSWIDSHVPIRVAVTVPFRAVTAKP